LHYIGHAGQAVDGQNAGHSTLQLETEVLTIHDTLREIPHLLEPNDVTGKGDRWAKRRPLVFFNACQTGRQDVGLVRPGGWARALLSSKAGAFVGTLWSVRDEAALLFSQVFYNVLLQDKKTFGQSALEDRAVAATKDPSWLAYVVQRPSGR
jgi:CHAT domain-containing protein